MKRERLMGTVSPLWGLETRPQDDRGKGCRRQGRILVAVACLAMLASVANAQGNPSSQSSAATPTADQEPKPQRGSIEFGVRSVWGDVYGRPDLPFRPSIFTSKYNEYRDVRNGFFVRRGHLILDDFVGTNNYLDIQTDKAIYKDQSYLATFGRWNVFQLQARYDEIPHTFSNTARTLFTPAAPGVFTISPLIRSTLQGVASSTTLPSLIQTQVVPGMGFYVPNLERRAGAIGFNIQLSPNWSYGVTFSREHQSGARPIGQIFNSSPSASLTGGYGVEIPEPTDYFNNRLVESTDYGRGGWGVQFSYITSILTTNIRGVTYDNPFRLTDCVAALTPAACTTATQGPARGRMDTYPNNHAQYFNVSGAFDLGTHARLMASITPAWLRQNQRFLPYTTNAPLAAQEPALPSSSLDGKKQTLAMNYTLVSRVHKNIELKAQYRHYDYNNDTPIRTFVPVQGDIAIGSPEENTPFGFNRKNIELSGTWFFARKSSWKVGYNADWMDRQHRDVDHSVEHTLFTGLDVNPAKAFNFRVSYLHGDRKPDEYVDENALPASISGGITEDLVQLRRFDEAPRLRDRVNAQASYDVSSKLSLSAFADTTQDDYNRRGGVNSPTPLNFISGRTNPFYSYGVLKDLSYDWGFDANYTVTPAANFFAEYSHERYHKRMVSRYRVPGGASPLPLDCSNSARGCDSPNNDWESSARDFVDIYTAGWDLQLGRRTFLTTYYSLSAAKGNVFSHPIGDPTIATGPNKFLLTGTNAAVDYPETTNRQHEVTAVLKYRLTDNLFPKIEYRYQQFDNKDYQTSPMTPYMGCVSGLPPAAPVPGCTSPLIGTPSPFYPYFAVGDTSAARYLFLGVDQPSYRVHYIAGTLEYHF